MNERSLFIIAFSCTLIGILLILFISEKIEIKPSLIKDLTEDKVGEEVRIIATINSIQATPGLYILTLKDDTSSIKAVIFKDSELEFKKYDKVEVSGELIKYNNILEIQVNQLNTI